MEKARRSNIRRMKKTQENLGQKKMGPELEAVATRRWMLGENPARSGDTKEICWMTKGADDFYHEDYRSVHAQCEIIKKALALDGDELRAAAVDPKNVWERNVRIYLDAVEENALDALTVHDIRPAGLLDIEAVIAEMDSGAEQKKKDAEKECWVCGDLGVGDEDGSEMGCAEEGGEYEGAGYGARVLRPRSQRFFYQGVLAGCGCGRDLLTTTVNAVVRTIKRLHGSRSSPLPC